MAKSTVNPAVSDLRTRYEYALFIATSLPSDCKEKQGWEGLVAFYKATLITLGQEIK